jgi:hypothetical protein
MLFWLNKHNSFSYVDIFGLTEPTDNVLSFLSHVAKKEKRHPHKLSFIPASMFGMLGVNIPGVSTRYISGSKRIVQSSKAVKYRQKLFHL